MTCASCLGLLCSFPKEGKGDSHGIFYLALALKHPAAKQKTSVAACYSILSLQSRFAPLSPGSGHAFMALCSSSEAADDPDSGLDENTTEAVVIKHIDRNILACQICQHRYREPKVCARQMRSYV